MELVIAVITPNATMTTTMLLMMMFTVDRKTAELSLYLIRAVPCCDGIRGNEGIASTLVASPLAGDRSGSCS
jgi:hypothetical protein